MLAFCRRVGQLLLLLGVTGCSGDDTSSNASSTASGGSDGSGGGGSNSAADFCDVLPILEDRCQRCHTRPTVNNAPFPLVTFADTQANAPDSTEKVHDLMMEVIEARIMPPTMAGYEPPVEDLSCNQRATLLSWLEAGAPRPRNNDPSCENESPELKDCGG